MHEHTLLQEQQQSRTEALLSSVQSQHEQSLRILGSLAKDAEQQRSQLRDCMASVAKLSEAVVEQVCACCVMLTNTSRHL